MHKVILLLFFLATSAGVMAQQYSLEINYSVEKRRDLKKLEYKKQFSSKPALEKEMGDFLQAHYRLGYLTAHYDSVVSDSFLVTAKVNEGQKYQLALLSKGNVNEHILAEAGYKAKFYTDKLLNYASIYNLCDKILTYLENNGYPFATIKLDSIEITDNVFKASLNLEKQNHIIFDSIIVRGSAKISHQYLSGYLGIHIDNLYSDVLVRNIESRIKDLPFVTQTKPPAIAFYPDKARIFLYLDAKKASRFDGIAGIAPNSQEDGKTLITGELHLKLMNPFGRAENIDIDWRKLEKSTQDLKIKLFYPYLFATPLGFDYDFHLYKKDTSYINLNNKLGVVYLLTGYNYFKAFYQNIQSSQINPGTFTGQSALPAYTDVNTSLYGLALRYEKTDNRLTPWKGYRLNVSGAAGTKKIKKTASLSQALFDSLETRTTIFQTELLSDVFIPAFSRMVIMLQTRNAGIFSDNLFENELYRFGGKSSLMGFDEESLRTSLYSIFTIELRYMLERNSYLGIFWNGAWYERKALNTYVSDTPTGFGAGMAFETKAGIFSLYYAIGQEFSNPFLFKSAKIHFGITSIF